MEQLVDMPAYTIQSDGIKTTCFQTLNHSYISANDPTACIVTTVSTWLWLLSNIFGPMAQKWNTKCQESNTTKPLTTVPGFQPLPTPCHLHVENKSVREFDFLRAGNRIIGWFWAWTYMGLIEGLVKSYRWTRLWKVHDSLTVNGVL